MAILLWFGECFTERGYIYDDYHCNIKIFENVFMHINGPSNKTKIRCQDSYDSYGFKMLNLNKSAVTKLRLAMHVHARNYQHHPYGKIFNLCAEVTQC